MAAQGIRILDARRRVVEAIAHVVSSISAANLSDRGKPRQRGRLLPAGLSLHAAAPHACALTRDRHIAIVRVIFALPDEA
ncbi:hypothetical protein OCUBac02_17120 [Bosea sp. ANAM02]|nr:hypothetical protein OCUBac02_17120 [Bosea sp. ANAM02]